MVVCFAKQIFPFFFWFPRFLQFRFWFVVPLFTPCVLGCFPFDIYISYLSKTKKMFINYLIVVSLLHCVLIFWELLCWHVSCCVCLCWCKEIQFLYFSLKKHLLSMCMGKSQLTCSLLMSWRLWVNDGQSSGRWILIGFCSWTQNNLLMISPLCGWHLEFLWRWAQSNLHLRFFLHGFKLYLVWRWIRKFEVCTCWGSAESGVFWWHCQWNTSTFLWMLNLRQKPFGTPS